jgi:isocitrate dehydrogenase (NAD+)
VTHRVALIPGDGTGPEIMAAMRRAIEATGVAIEWEVQPAGACVIEREGTPLPQRVLDSLKQNRVALKGPITTPVGRGFPSVSVALRKARDLYANLRPCMTYWGVPTCHDNVDLVIVHETTEDLYVGQNKVNSTAAMLTSEMMLRHLDERVAADRLERAIVHVIAEGKRVTYDLKPRPNDPTTVGTSQFADAVIEALCAPRPTAQPR